MIDYRNQINPLSLEELQKHSNELINADKKNEKIFQSLEKKYKKIQKEMVSAMKAVHFNSSTIEALMEALYELNKKLVSFSEIPCELVEDFIQTFHLEFSNL